MPSNLTSVTAATGRRPCRSRVSTAQPAVAPLLSRSSTTATADPGGGRGPSSCRRLPYAFGRSRRRIPSRGSPRRADSSTSAPTSGAPDRPVPTTARGWNGASSPSSSRLTAGSASAARATWRQSSIQPNGWPFLRHPSPGRKAQSIRTSRTLRRSCSAGGSRGGVGWTSSALTEGGPDRRGRPRTSTPGPVRHRPGSPGPRQRLVSPAAGSGGRLPGRRTGR